MNQATVFESEWMGQSAYIIEIPEMRFITTPGVGAKIVSIFDKKANREWLLPPANRPFQAVSYGASFVEQDMSGWDEMFPTIEPCAYPVAGPFEGANLPDHGEVWSVPWDIVDIQSDSVTMAVTGRAIPYRFKRTIRAIRANAMRLEYEVLNTTQEEIVMLWAAHPQFKVDAETRIVLPPEIDTVLNVQETEEWGAVGTRYGWPIAHTSHGQPFELDRANGSDLHKYRKFYLLPEQSVHWAALVQSSNEHWLRLQWDPEQIPYLGLWIDEGGFSPVSTIALEPSTGYYDNLSHAWDNQHVMTMRPNASYHWHIDIETGTGLQNIGKRS